jgi:IS30 family transposase
MSNGRQWTAKDLRRLLEWRGRGWTYESIAAAIGRSRGSVASKLLRINNPEHVAEYRERNRERDNARHRARRLPLRKRKPAPQANAQVTDVVMGHGSLTDLTEFITKSMGK